MIVRRYSVFLLLFWCLLNIVQSQSTWQIESSSPRLCSYHLDPTQYYPCVLNYVGLNSWSLYRCPNKSIFDETLQQCLAKILVGDTFDQLASFPSTKHAPFYRVASFIMATPMPFDDVTDWQQQEQQHNTRLVSLPPTIDKLMESISTKKIIQKRAESDPDSQTPPGMLWSHGYPLMKLDEIPAFESKPSINSRSHHFSTGQRYPIPVSEDELKYKKICYFTNWAQYRIGPGKFVPENIDPFLCTHIIYAFAYINNETLLITTVEENDEDLYRRINALKLRNPKLKTLLGVGGWNMQSHAFSAMVHENSARRQFIFHTINFLRKHNFDGLEADWEYPGMRGGQNDDKYYLTRFFQEFKEAAMAQAIITGQPRLLLAAAVAASQDIVANGYEIEKISKILDFINIMTYDFHGAWQSVTGLNAPLYKRLDEFGTDAMLNQDFGIAIWLHNGAPAHKLVLGLPLFARTFLLERADRNDLRSPIVGNGTQGPFTRSAGFLSYYEVCVLQTDSTWQKRPVPDGSESFYMFKDREWVSYDTLESVRKRAAYVVANNLGGMFVWSVDMDDFTGGFCNNGTYPYIKNSLSLLPTSMPSYI